jgi:hypothetical protein
VVSATERDDSYCRHPAGTTKSRMGEHPITHTALERTDEDRAILGCRMVAPPTHHHPPQNSAAPTLPIKGSSESSRGLPAQALTAGGGVAVYGGGFILVVYSPPKC